VNLNVLGEKGKKLILRYQSGEEIKKGDRVLFHRQPAEIEFVVTNANDPSTAWYFEEFGGGALVRDPRDPNPTFIDAAGIPDYEDLEFVGRAGST
jgi:hypothetical protein